MDLLSHALVGGLVAAVGLQKKYGLVASVTMVAANLIPDLDGALAVMGPKYFLQYHRHPLTHSVGGAALLSAVLTTVVCLATPFKRPGLIFSISFMGMMLHLISDLLTPWPIPLLWPFSAKAYSLDLINFIDPFLLAVLGMGFLVVQRRPMWAVPPLVFTMLVTSGYLGFRAYGRQVALNLVQRGDPLKEIAALPYGLNPITWNVIVREGRGYAYYVVDSFRRGVRSSQFIRSTGDERVIAASRSSSLVQAFLKRARFPVTFSTEEGNRIIVEWRDVHLMINGGALKGVKVVLNEQEEIIEERFELNARK